MEEKLKKRISFNFVIIFVTLIPLNLVLSDFIIVKEFQVKTVKNKSTKKNMEILQVAPDPNFEDDSVWNFSSVTATGPTSTLPNDP